MSDETSAAPASVAGITMRQADAMDAETLELFLPHIGHEPKVDLFINHNSPSATSPTQPLENYSISFSGDLDKRSRPALFMLLSGIMRMTPCYVEIAYLITQQNLEELCALENRFPRTLRSNTTPTSVQAIIRSNWIEISVGKGNGADAAPDVAGSRMAQCMPLLIGPKSVDADFEHPDGCCLFFDKNDDGKIVSTLVEDEPRASRKVIVSDALAPNEIHQLIYDLRLLGYTAIFVAERADYISSVTADRFNDATLSHWTDSGYAKGGPLDCAENIMAKAFMRRVIEIEDNINMLPSWDRK